MTANTPTNARIVAAITANPPGWHPHHQQHERGSNVTPHGGDHPGGHNYDPNCAICRAGDRPEALYAVVHAAATACMADPDGIVEHDSVRSLILAINNMVSVYVMRTETSALARAATTNEIADLIHNDLTILATGWIDTPSPSQ